MKIEVSKTSGDRVTPLPDMDRQSAYRLTFSMVGPNFAYLVCAFLALIIYLLTYILTKHSRQYSSPGRRLTYSLTYA